MDYFFISLYTIIAFGLLIFYLISDKKRVQKKRARFLHRDDLSMDQLYDRYFLSSGINKELFEEHWVRIAKMLKLKPGLLRPGDTFDKELAPVPDVLMVDDEIEDVYEYYWGIADDHGFEIEAKTLGDLVLLFASKGL